ncbi:hypothetical protein ACFX13_036428 [Malus domestica]
MRVIDKCDVQSFEVVALESRSHDGKATRGYARVPSTRIIKIKEGQCRIAPKRFARPKVGAANRCICKGSGACGDNCLGLCTNASCVQTYDGICGTKTLSSNPALPSRTVW